jgi:hypothetical protein
VGDTGARLQWGLFCPDSRTASPLGFVGWAGRFPWLSQRSEKAVPALHHAKFPQRSSVAERVRNDAPTGSGVWTIQPSPKTVLTSDGIQRRVSAYEQTLRDSQSAQVIAKKIIQIGQSGVHDRRRFPNWPSSNWASISASVPALSNSRPASGWVDQVDQL